MHGSAERMGICLKSSILGHADRHNHSAGFDSSLLNRCRTSKTAPTGDNQPVSVKSCKASFSSSPLSTSIGTNPHWSIAMLMVIIVASRQPVRDFTQGAFNLPEPPRAYISPHLHDDIGLNLV